MKKEVLAAIIAVVVIVAAAAVLIMNNENDEKSLPVDTLRTDLKVGDKIERNVKTATTLQKESPDDTRDKFLSFFGDGTDSYDEYYMDGMEEVTYKGEKVICYIFKMPDKTAYLSDSLIEYVIEQDGTVITLVDSNIDLSKPKAEMVLQKGSFIQYSIVGKFLGIVTEKPTIFTKTIEKVNDDGTYVSNTAISITYSENTVMTITEIDKDGTLSVNDGKNEYNETKDKFLSNISFTYVEKTEKNLKILGEKTAVIDTEFGKRSVTVKSVEITSDTSIVGKGKYYCGNDGILYLTEADLNIGGQEMSISVTLKNSTLLTIGS